MKQFAEEISIRPIPSRIGNDREYAMQGRKSPSSPLFSSEIRLLFK